MKNVTCKKCGWVHYSVSYQEAQLSVDQFNDYYNKLSSHDQNSYYKSLDGKLNPLTLDRYKKCMSCGNKYSDFRNSIDSDCPKGCTLNPIIHFNENS